MVLNVNMFCPLMKHLIFSKVNSTLTVIV
jgi:hypothetical protein